LSASFPLSPFLSIPFPRVRFFTTVNYHPILDARHVYLYIAAIKRRPKAIGIS